jgi:chemotaxis protein CheD
MREIKQAGTVPEEYDVKIFGGGHQFAQNQRASGIDVPGRNIEAGLRLLEEFGIEPGACHLGGTGARQVILDLHDGQVWVRHTAGGES